MGKQELKTRPFFAKCVVLELITAGLIVLTVLVISYTSENMTAKIKKWYIKNVLDETSVNEVIKENYKYEI